MQLKVNGKNYQIRFEEEVSFRVIDSDQQGSRFGSKVEDDEVERNKSDNDDRLDSNIHLVSDMEPQVNVAANKDANSAIRDGKKELHLEIINLHVGPEIEVLRQQVINIQEKEVEDSRSEVPTVQAMNDQFSYPKTEYFSGFRR